MSGVLCTAWPFVIVKPVYRQMASACMGGIGPGLPEHLFDSDYFLQEQWEVMYFFGLKDPYPKRKDRFNYFLQIFINKFWRI